MLSFIPLLIVGSMGILYTINTMRNFAVANLTQDVSVINERAKKFLSDINEDLAYIGQSPVFRNYLRTQSAATSKTERARKKELLLRQILAFVKTRPVYYQIYFIDKQRDEKFKIQFYDSSYFSIPRNQLSEGRFTFRLEERRVGKECRSRWSPYH